MNPTLNDILHGLVETLATDEAVTSWVQEHHGQDTTHQVHLGVDQEHPPRPEGCPVIEIATGKRRRNLDTRCVVHQVMVGVFVHCADRNDRDNTYAAKGVQWVNELALLVEHACIAWLRANNVLWHPAESFPDASMGRVFRAVWTLDISVRDMLL